MSNTATISQPYAGAYPERAVPRESWLDRFGIAAAGPIIQWHQARRSDFDSFVSLVTDTGQKLEIVDEDELKVTAKKLQQRLRREGIDNDELTAESFALIREVAQRKLQMRHYDVQLIGGLILLRGMVAEMETGEGKTLTATLAACTAAFAGLPVHIITVNDYLVSRDAEWMRPLYETLGLSVGTITQGMDPEARRDAYACDITYCSNKELAFDYLKDRIALGNRRSRIRLQLERLYGKESKIHRLLLRGLCFAIVDETDSVLIDEARTPLIISGAGNVGDEKRIYEEALAIAAELVEHDDFENLTRQRSIRLTEDGKFKIEELAEPLGGLWTGTQRREELVRQALAAQHFYLKDKHYIVRDGKVQIVDEYTGRTMPDRSWESGLHQMIETRENCELTGRRETIARISYQRFFRRYLRLAGMSGTAKEVSQELWSVYRLNVVTVPTNKPVKRVNRQTAIYPKADDKWKAIVQRIADIHAQQRPVLVGTRSVEASEHLGRLLQEKGLQHQVLNARQDKDEAQVIENAGKSGQIMVATNMAGRGTDIKLDADVSDLGGLHVIITELHEAKRIDRQLIGRCGRQGDNGSFEMILSLEDELIAMHIAGVLRRLAIVAAQSRFSYAQVIPELIMRLGQYSAERLHSRTRRDLLKMDEQLDTALAFSGHIE